jgi:lipopolysaccharide transport system permease protein
MTPQNPSPTAEQAPSVLIAPTRGRAPLNLRELWANRELIYYFVWRDTKVRYRQTVFGVLWAVLQPLALMVVFALFLGRLSGIAPTNIPYPVFALVGLVPWTLFSKSVLASSDSLVGASSLLQKVYFPRLIVPIAAIGTLIPDFLISLIVLLIFLLAGGIALTLKAILIIPLTIIGLAFALGLGSWLSALNVRYRDIRQVVPLVVQIWLFASPVAYATSIVPEQWRFLYELNPIVGLIEGYRWALLEQPLEFPMGPILMSCIAAAAFLMTGLIYFRRVERTFADVI